MDNKLLVKNILYAISIGMTINCIFINKTLANDKPNNEKMEISKEQLETVERLSQDIENVDSRLNRFIETLDKYNNCLQSEDISLNIIKKGECISAENVKYLSENHKLNKINKILEIDDNQQSDFQQNEQLVVNNIINKNYHECNSINGKKYILVEQDEFDDITNNFNEINRTKVNNSFENIKFIGNLDFDNNYNAKSIEKNNIKIGVQTQDIIIERNYMVNMNSDDAVNEVRESAVIKARNGDYDTSLAMLKQLYQDNKNDLKIAYDYLTVLNWAGKYEDVINMYEMGNFVNLPNYVEFNVASAYYRLNLYDKAEQLLISNDDKESKMLLGQIYIKANRIKQADDVYTKLVQQYPNDLNIYLEKAATASAIQNWQISLETWEKIREIYEKTPIDIIKKQDIMDNLAIAYIRLGKYKEANTLLVPFIEDKTATVNIVGNYLITLNNLNRFKEVPMIFERFFTEYQDAPNFIIRELANSYIKMEDYQKAVNLYKYLFESRETTLEDKYLLAHYAIRSKDSIFLVPNIYRSILKEQVKSDENLTTRILREAKTLLDEGYYQEADIVYKELINYDKRYYNLYAEDLYNSKQYLAALRKYTIMTNDIDLYKDGLEGIVKVANDFNVKDYNLAEVTYAILKNNYKEESDYAKAAGSINNRQIGESYVNVFNYADYDDSNDIDINIWANQYIGNGFWIESEWGKSFIKDNENNDTTNFNTKRLGIRYIDKKWNNLVTYSVFDLGDNKNGLSIDSLFKITDNQWINFIYSYEPILDVEALKMENGPILGDNYSLRYGFSRKPNENYYIELNKSEYDDGNKRYGWNVGQSLNIYENESTGISLNRNIYWGRNHYSNQEVVYNSPKLNEIIGMQWRWSKSIDASRNETLHSILGIEWERDYPDELTLNPYIGLEYDKTIDDYQYMNLGIVYGMRTNSWLGEGSWKYNKRMIYGMYNYVW